MEIAARRLALRLCERLGGGTPAWHWDHSTFPPSAMSQITEALDSRLHQPMLQELSLLTGHSPSHFARKFRVTTGLSLGRFLNRRRVAAALVALRDDPQSLAQVALDLGFSSRSHFTRLFSSLTGMTPAKYRRLFKPAIG